MWRNILTHAIYQIIDSVKILKKAGIKVIMCTGDNIDTATAISLNAGIVS